MTQPESLKPILCIEQWELNGSKNNCTAKGDITLQLKKSDLSYLIFTTVWGQKRFQQLWMYDFFKHRKLPCIPCLEETHFKLQWYNISVSLFLLFCFCNATFFHFGYVITPPQPSSAFYRAPILCKCFSRTCHELLLSSVPAFSFICELNGGFEHDVANSLWSSTFPQIWHVLKDLWNRKRENWRTVKPSKKMCL